MTKSGMDAVIGKADNLIEALPYIRNFAGKTFVIKYGGHAMVSEILKNSVAEDIVMLKYIGINPIVVHGGGNEITDMMRRMGKQAEFVGGLRVTDKETMELVEMILVGKVNPELVQLLNKYGGKGVGLNGKDSNMLLARKMPPVSVLQEGKEVLVDLGYVGDLIKVDPEIVLALSRSGYIPVISSVGVSPEGEGLNINADYVAGELAAALQAEKLILLTDVEGIFGRQGDADSRISSLERERAKKMIVSGEISSGMIPKVEACFKALEGQVRRTHIIDGRLSHSLLLEIFTDKGIGTMVL